MIGDRGVMSEIALAISDEGRLAVIKRSEYRVELYGGADGKDARPVNITTKQNLIRPYNLCFAPMNHLLITDIGDRSIKIYSLKNKEPELVRKIACYEKKAQAIIQMETSAGPFSALSSSSDKYLTPFTVTAGPSPLSQIFAVFENYIFVITIDWNSLELIDYRRLSTQSDWSSVQCKMKKECDKTSIVHDHKDNHKVGGQNPLAVTEGQFCAMFYHVTETKRGKIDFHYKCLQTSKCRVGKKARSNPRADYAATVVVYVRLTDQNGRLIFHARYGNCFEGERRNTIHAEYFMLVDEEFRQAVKFLGDQKGKKKIKMYMNKQPCFRSTRHHDKIPGLKRKECSQDLVKFYTSYCLSHNIKLTINLCQLYKVDMPSSSSLKDIENAKKGMEIMKSAGIKLKAMTENSWLQLAGYADIELPEYTNGDDRQKLDQHIAEFLKSITS